MEKSGMFHLPHLLFFILAEQDAPWFSAWLVEQRKVTPQGTRRRLQV